MNELFDTLNALGAEIERKIIQMNWGGCCVFAVEAAKRFPIPCRILVSDPYNNNSLTTVRRRVRENRVFEWNNNGVCFGHVFLEFDYEGKTYHYDSEGVREPKTAFGKSIDPSLRFTILDGCLDLAEAIELAKDKDGWNYVFDRDQIPKVKRIMRKHLGKIIRRK